MHRLLIDNDFKASIVEGLIRALGPADALTLRTAGLHMAMDRDVLRFACAQRRILLSHDTRRMPQEARALIVEEGLVPRVLLVPQRLAIGRAIAEAAVVLGAGGEDD